MSNELIYLNWDKCKPLRRIISDDVKLNKARRLLVCKDWKIISLIKLIFASVFLEMKLRLTIFFIETRISLCEY